MLKGSAFLGNIAGNFHISVYENAVEASFSLDNGMSFAVTSDASRTSPFLALQTDHDGYAPEMMPIQVSDEAITEAMRKADVAAAAVQGEEDDLAHLSPRAAAATGTTVSMDILVAYSKEAESKKGGSAQMMSAINLAVSESNTICSNSALSTLKFRLVGVAGPYDVSETSFNSILTGIKATSDGYCDNLITRRAETGADAVVFITSLTSACGLGYQMTTLSDAFKTSAFSVTSYNCMTGYYSFAHELGHNMGITHDVANSGGQAVYNYGYGWRWDSDAYRSVMAYAPGTRVAYWSNPSVTRNGFATGAALANNAQALTNTKGTAANWYPARMCAGLSQAFCTDAVNSNCKYENSECKCIDTSSSACLTSFKCYASSCGSYVSSSSSSTTTSSTSGGGGAS